ncbi:hypothetical protein TRVL_06916 [Trypanosoma vivax]|nr:hypothetical protein TRVL_06916 [Trypanosoma vivax]
MCTTRSGNGKQLIAAIEENSTESKGARPARHEHSAAVAVNGMDVTHANGQTGARAEHNLSEWGSGQANKIGQIAVATNVHSSAAVQKQKQKRRGGRDKNGFQVIVFYFLFALSEVRQNCVNQNALRTHSNAQRAKKREAWHMFRCALAFTLNYITFCAASTSCCLSAAQHRSGKALERPAIKANTKQQHKSIKIGLPVTMGPVLF